MSRALVAAFARYCEILIERINLAPRKALLAFVNLLGMSPHPPQAAVVPLSFSVTPKCTEVVRVPARSQVAGPGTAEGGQPIVFETEEDLYVSPVTLESIISRDPQRDRYGTLSHLAGTVTAAGVRLFEASQPTDHSLYLGHSTLLSRPSQELSVRVEVREPQAAVSIGMDIRWEIWKGKEWMPVIPQSDETHGLTRSGRIIFRAMPGSLTKVISGMAGAWLRGRLLTPFMRDQAADSQGHWLGETVRVKHIMLQVRNRIDNAGIKQAFVNQIPLDMSKEVYVFGERPRFGDVLYVSHAEALGAGGGRVSLHVELLNPRGGGPHGSIPETFASDDLSIQWEISGAGEWKVLGTSHVQLVTEDAATEFRDETQAFTKSGDVSFLLPVDIGQQSINGVKAVWVRARILAGDYGKEATYYPRDQNAPDKGYLLKPATLGPPIVKALTISRESVSPEEGPESVIICNDFSYRNMTSTLQEGGAGFAPFIPMEGEAPALHLGFRAPDQADSLSGYPLNMYFHCDDETSDPEHGMDTRLKSGLAWDYWNGTNWSALSVVDRTDSLRRPGVVRFDAPSDWQLLIESDQQQPSVVTAMADHLQNSAQEPGARNGGLVHPLHWIRARASDERLLSQVQCRGIVLHTVMALHAMTLREEVLGNSNGTVDQSCRTLRTPVLPGQVLEVRETHRNGDKVWVEWKSVDHFLHSGPQDRHYTIDRQTGMITFGDGTRGAIPPSGINNIVMKEYRIGGGSVGNVPVESMVQLRTTMPFVQKVLNLVPAYCGADSESLEVFVGRALRVVRHRNRAVTAEDYEDLALAASPLVAGAYCVSFYDLVHDPLAQRRRSGVLSLIVLPCVDSEVPQPDRALLELVRAHVTRCAPTGIDVRVVPPHYVPVNVVVHVILQPDAVPAEVRKTIQSEISRFLHPLAGGSDGRGWRTGKYPPKSSLHSRIMKVPLVHHILGLSLGVADEATSYVRSGFFNVCSGTHRIECHPLSAG
ncbi:MAG: hypothetical protein NTNFB02_23340 [Nitrospira sp.]